MLTILFIPNSAIAQNGTDAANNQIRGTDAANNQLQGVDVARGNSQGTRSGQSVTLQNPLQADSIVGLFQAILNVVTILVVPVIVFFIIYAGFLYVTARGNPAEISKAHNALLYAIIGGVIILGANLIMDLIQGTIESF